MADINASLYDFVYFLGAILFFLWFVRQLLALKGLQSLARALRSSTVVLLDELSAAGQRVTPDAVRSLLSKKKIIHVYDVEPLSLASSINGVRLIDRVGGVDCELSVDVCSRLPGRVDLFVGVPRSLVSMLHHNYVAFNQRPHAPSTAETKHAKVIHKQIQPSLRTTAAPPFFSATEFSFHSAQTQPEATMSTPLAFALPRVTLEKVMKDASLLPVVLLLSPLPACTPPSTAGGHLSRSAAPPPASVSIELAPTSSARAMKLQRWLSSQPHPPSPSLQSLTLLSASSGGEDGALSLSVATTLIVSPSPPFTYRCEEVFGLQDEPDCLVCLSEPKSVVLLPCRHLSVCEECLAGFQQHKCPVCRTPLEDYCVFEEEEAAHGADAVPEEAKRQQKEN